MSHREPIDDAAWRPWVEHVATALEVDASPVSPRAIHDLTGEVASRYQRPMAPVSAYLWGLATATHPDRDPGDLAQAIIAALPET